jgi:hypothetical protein
MDDEEIYIFTKTKTEIDTDLVFSCVKNNSENVMPEYKKRIWFPDISKAPDEGNWSRGTKLRKNR